MNKLEVYVATHKEYTMPKEEIYKPIFVGSSGKESILNYTRDDIGDNISEKNPYYCELTALYWLWKNSNASYVGLVHYRRHLIEPKKKQKDKFNSILSAKTIYSLINENKIIVPKKRKYYIETLYSHYSHSHYHEHLDWVRKIILETDSSYIDSFDSTMKQRSGYMFNMFIMSKQNVERYCNWLFPILNELEKYINLDDYNPFQSRLYGRVSELLFNVWLNENQVEIVELPWGYMEKVNEIEKGISFLKAKLFNRKFTNSF